MNRLGNGNHILYLLMAHQWFVFSIEYSISRGVGSIPTGRSIANESSGQTGKLGNVAPDFFPRDEFLRPWIRQFFSGENLSAP